MTRNTFLIGDIGSTKAGWVSLDGDKETRYSTSGYNPVNHDRHVCKTMLTELADQCITLPLRIIYYGTGIIGDPQRQTMKALWQEQFGASEMTIESDLLGAARALSNGVSGIVCILGTGSNSCHFDGQKIVRQIPGLGWPLGDEGSAADIGRSLVRAFYYGLLPRTLKDSLAEVLPADRTEFIARYNADPAPNRYLGALAMTLATHGQATLVEEMLLERFLTFARLRILPYGIAGPVHFAGGIAAAYAHILREALEHNGLQVGTITADVLPGLIAYHKGDS